MEFHGALPPSNRASGTLRLLSSGSPGALQPPDGAPSALLTPIGALGALSTP